MYGMVLVYLPQHNWVILWQMLGYILQHHGSHIWFLPSGKHTKNQGKPQFLMGKLTRNCHVQ
jgi:hypothetical protein